LTANRYLVGFTMICVCVREFCKRQAVLWILFLVEVLSRRLQHLNYYMGWRSVGDFTYKGTALVLWVALCID